MTASIPDGMSFSDLESLLESAPSDVTDAPQSDDDEDTRSDLQKIADKNPNTPLADRFSRRSTKDIQKEKVVKKYNLKDTIV